MSRAAVLRFSCRRLVFTCNIAVPFETAAFLELRETLRRDGALVRQREIVAWFEDPVEALAIAQSHHGKPFACIASPAALELLRDPNPLATTTWQWLCEELQIDPSTELAHGLVHLGGLLREAWELDEDRLPAEPGVLLWIGGSLVLLTARTSFGRAELGGGRASFPIVDHAMASRHFVIERAISHWTIQDLGSPGGTFTDGHRVVEPLELVPGMVITAGTSTFGVVAVCNE